jgi:hypothetical protein
VVWQHDINKGEEETASEEWQGKLQRNEGYPPFFPSVASRCFDVSTSNGAAERVHIEILEKNPPFALQVRLFRFNDLYNDRVIIYILWQIIIGIAAYRFYRFHGSPCSYHV